MRLGHVQGRILRYLLARQGEAVLPLLGADSTSTNLATFRLEDLGLVEDMGPGSSGPHGRYRLTDEGRRVAEKIPAEQDRESLWKD